MANTDGRTSTRLAACTAALVGAAALGACSASSSANATAPSAHSRVAVSLGSGDAVGARIRAHDILITGRDAWDRDTVLAVEATRLAEGMLINGQGGTRIATESPSLD